MKLGLWAADLAERDVADPGNPDKYSQGVGAYYSGFSALGCRIQDSAARSASDSPGFPNANTRDARACIGFAGHDLFLIVCEGDDQAPGGAEGWTWSHMQSFFSSGLPAYMQATYSYPVQILNAVALDGGGSTSFRYRMVGAQGKGRDEKWHAEAGPDGKGRRVRSLALGSTH
jgi:hypothetical protein